MNKINILASAFAFLAISACKDDFPSRDESPLENNSSMKIHFSDIKTTYAINNSDNSISINLTRENCSSATSVALNYNCTDNILELPSSVDFASGESTKSIDIKFVKDLEYFKKYQLFINLELTPDQSNFYGTSATAPQCITTIVKDDYTRYAKGSFKSSLFGSWKMEIEYSAIQNSYRLRDLIADNHDLEFKLNEGNNNYFKVISGNEDKHNVMWKTGNMTSEGMTIAEFEATDTPDGNDYYHGTFKNDVFTFSCVTYAIETTIFGEQLTETFTITERF